MQILHLYYKSNFWGLVQLINPTLSRVIGT